MKDTIYREDALDALYSVDEYNVRSVEAIKGLPSAQLEQKWETCFDCPLSHGCPKINGCTNGQTMDYASEVPDDCPISVQPRKGKWKIRSLNICHTEWKRCECSVCGWEAHMYKDDVGMKYCPNCGCRNIEGGKQDDSV